MNAVRLWKLGLACFAAVVVLVGTSAALAGSLVAIPKVTNLNPADLTVQVGTLPTSITPDGLYVGGIAGLGYSTSGEDTGFVYDVVGGTSKQVVAGSYQASVNGIGYRYPTTGGVELVVGGDNGGWQSMNASTDGGLTWAKRRRAGGSPEGYAGHAYAGGYNTVNGGSAGLDRIFATFKTPDSAGPQLYVDGWAGGSPGNWLRVPPLAPDTKGTGTESDINGVSNAGVAVGRRKVSSVYNNYVLTYDGDGGLGAVYTNGLNGTTAGELWDIADDGSLAGGMSPQTGKTGLWAYVRDMATGSVFELPTAVSSAAYTTNSLVYGMAPNGDYAVGMDYTAAGTEKAVLWDLRSANPNNWTVLDLTDWASGQGILGPFTGNLRRAYAVGISPNSGDPVITGVGVASSLEPNGWTGFVLTVPEPGTVTLLAIGGLVLLLLRRRR